MFSLSVDGFPFSQVVKVRVVCFTYYAKQNLSRLSFHNYKLYRLPMAVDWVIIFLGKV